ncbi:collagenase-like PrtC family protease [Inhella inkyongensis]|uniref:Ubiquinone biosynthesis protein UbiV n=1 Tax=Inhella inkyongensis TaxID=392593 RepID=A0A840S1J9_9BURK|nr:U32 family peptidase [Inhella inkyongensis]MBB5205017.1 collagenase-like PrtC family protease [Inhella inkyongensis]
MQLTIGPLLYWWPRAALMDFYAQVAEGPAQTVVLGELVCSRRNEFKFDDWVALGRELAVAGKRVVLATQALVMSEAELRSLRRLCEQDEFAVEAGDASALRVLAAAAAADPSRQPFVLGPHINIYNRAALEEHAALGAGHWVAPVELALDAVGAINPPAEPVLGIDGPIRTEVFAFGRLPLAFSARCFTARHHRLSKDGCEFRCRDDADGLLLQTTEGQPFLALNGIQSQSAALQCLITQTGALRRAGVSSLRLSPCGLGFARVVELFQAVLTQSLCAREALAELRQLPLPGTLVDGFARRHAGLEEVMDPA